MSDLFLYLMGVLHLKCKHFLFFSLHLEHLVLLSVLIQI